MGLNIEFQEKVKLLLDDIDQDTLAYDESEFWMIQSAYEYVEFFATKNQLLNTAIALPLARGLHNGDHRKSTITKGDISYRVPYLIHPLMVCKFLIEIRPPMRDEELDILLASALCHDMIEDIPFLENGKELTILYHLNPKIYDTVRKVSKRKDFTEQEEIDHFQSIARDKFAALVKLSDRGNNVEDLYNMSAWKVHEYVDETRKFLLPICHYGIDQYRELSPVFQLLLDKLVCLTDAAERLVDRYEEREQQIREQIEALRTENKELRCTWKKLWKIS